MPSGPTERRSLQRRVVWSTALAAALGGVIAAAAGGIATSRFVDDHEAEGLAKATLDLANEVADEVQEDDESPAEALRDELEEVDYVGARAVIRQGVAIVAGDRSLPEQAPGTCEVLELADGPHRACTVTQGGRQVTLAVDVSRTLSLRPLFALAACVGVLFGVGAGILLGRHAAARGLGPVLHLRDQVRRVRPDAPSADVLEPAAQYVELEELRRAVVELVERLGASLSQAQTFAAQASHELRTPLTTIACEIELLAEAAPASDAPALEQLRARVDSLSRLVERLLVLSMPRDPQTGEAVDLADVAADVIGGLPADQKGRVELETADDVLVRGDSMLLGTALSNAVENALKFSSEGVFVRVGGSLTEAYIEVADLGPGIDERDRDRIFEPFYRGRAARLGAVRGSGVGLALIAHVVAGHGGRVELGEADRGARLRLLLPRWTALDTSSAR